MSDADLNSLIPYLHLGAMPLWASASSSSSSMWLMLSLLAAKPKAIIGAKAQQRWNGH